MAFGRSASLALLATLAVSSVACSQSASEGEDSAADSVAVTVDATSLITLDPSLPFTVKQMHSAAGRIHHARWGQHGGPLATFQDDPAQAPQATRWFIPNGASAPAGEQTLRTPKPDGLPDNPDLFYWNAEGLRDTPLGALNAYATTTENNAGELFLFSQNYDQLLQRAHVNGYASGVTVDDNGTTRVIYSGLSGITADAQPTNDAGLWSSAISAASLVPADGTASTQLFKWSGSPGPVALDNNGNLFVAPFLTGGAHSTAVYGLAKNQTLAQAAQEPATLSESDAQGTVSIAAVAAAGADGGWVFSKGWDIGSAQPVIARKYKATADAVTADGDVIAAAIKPVLQSSTISLFSDPKGALWVSVTTEAGAWLIELEQNP